MCIDVQVTETWNGLHALLVILRVLIKNTKIQEKAKLVFELGIPLSYAVRSAFLSLCTVPPQHI